jgi:hypothetical protein
MCNDFEYVVHVAFDIVNINNDILTSVRWTMATYLNWMLRLCHVSLDIINPSKIFNIYGLKKNSTIHLVHINYFIFM